MRDIIIVGGGLAGLLVAWELIQRGAENVCVIDKTHPKRASAVPRAMLHMFSGRSFRPRDTLQASFDASVAMLEAWKPLAEHTVLPLPMIRPLVEGHKASQQLLASWEQDQRALHERKTPVWRASAAEVAQRWPWLRPGNGALWYEPAWSVALGELLPKVRAQLAKEGVTFLEGNANKVVQRGATQAVWVARDQTHSSGH